jgi:hypothetical protein
VFVHIQCFARPNGIITASLDHYPFRESLKYTLLVQSTDSEVFVQLLYKNFSKSRRVKFVEIDESLDQSSFNPTLLRYYKLPLHVRTQDLISVE